MSVFANVGGGPRLMAFGPNGVLYAAVRWAGIIVAVPSADQVVTVLRGMNGPHSIAFRGNDLYVAVDNGVLRYADAVTGDLVITSDAQRLVTLPAGGQHSTRTAAFGPDDKLYVTAGSTCNFCVETDLRRAAMMRYEADGSGETVIARGLRNSVAFAWKPDTGELWANDNGGDGLGDDAPPEEINLIREGADYGWPDCMGDRIGVEWGPEARPDRCADTEPPLVAMQGHSAPLGISFYTGDQFPASFRNNALVAFHGSWNRSEPTGYKVVRVHDGMVEDFLWGFLDVAARTQSGRPVHAITGPDGAVYVSDDATGNIYRVVYTGPRIDPGGLVDLGGGAYQIHGANLVNDPAQLTVTANGEPVELSYADANEIDVQLPGDLSAPIVIMVTNDRAADSINLP